MQTINFNYNWNNKLNCKSFTTIRPKSSKYKIGEKYKIMLKNQFLYDAVIVDIRTFKLDKVNEFIARIDTGYSKEECVDIMKKMYGENAENLEYFLILLSRLE
ncbi:MAG: hypothetical protein KatS3mg096_641 [Candidatus Parcubacteria bacterium]|nr:MAG: hypothetical protein KatS3mg096_641 [Candidatus Parcubacteria bacterium]